MKEAPLGRSYGARNRSSAMARISWLLPAVLLAASATSTSAQGLDPLAVDAKVSRSYGAFEKRPALPKRAGEESLEADSLATLR